MRKKIAVFLFDGFSDWEISYFAPEINKSELFDLVYFSTNGDRVTSMGGLNVTPTVSLGELDGGSVDLLVVPGGTAWERGENGEITDLVNKCFENGKPIAAICAATSFLGQLGLLDNLKHTSNDLGYLKASAPKYNGEGHYQSSLSVSDSNVITACGIAPIEFAKEIFKAIGLFNEDDLEKWFQLFKYGIWNG